MTKRLLASLGVLGALAASPALAHTGIGHASGLAAGLAHPFLGADHLLAMLSVGIWSALAAPRKAWLAPAAFVAAMIVGATLGIAGIGLPAVESMVAASVLALGLMVVAGTRLPAWAGIALIGVFAVFHGHAHGSEATGAIVAYIVGFASATATIHLAGIGIGLTAARATWLRYGLGLVVAGSGMAMLAGG